MSPFVFQPYQPANTTTIAELMGRQGSNQADLLRAQAAIRARSAEQGAQAWGGAANTIGSLVANLPQQIQQQKAQQQTQQIRGQQIAAQGLQLDQAQREAQGQKAVGSMLQGDQMAPGDTGPRQESYLDQNGLFDIPKLTQALGSSGYGDLAPQLLKGAESMNASIMQHQAATEQAARTHAVAIGDAANGVQQLVKAGWPIEQAMDFVVQPLVATKTVDPREYAQMRQQLLQAPPEAQQAALQHLMDAANRLAPEKPLSEGAIVPNRYGGTPTAANPKPTPQPTEATVAMQAAGGNTQAAAAMGLLKPKAEPSMQSENVLLDGKPAKVNFNPKAGTYTDASGADVSARVKPMPPASVTYPNPQGDQALKDVVETIKGMKDGTLPPILPGRATKEYNALLAEAHRQGFDLSAAATDWAATQKHVATMNGAQQTRLNQSVNALPDLLDSVEALAKQWKGGQFPLLNKASLAAAKNGIYGKQAASIANQLESQIADVNADLATVYMGGNSPTDRGLELASKALKSDWDEKVLMDGITRARSNVQIRQNSIRNTGVQGASDSNPYVPQTGGAVKMRAPNGDVQDVAADQVEYFKSRGATVVR